MWPKWLAKTLDRSGMEPRPHAAGAKRQRVPDVEAFRVDELRVDGALIGTRADDWELVTGFRIHLGYDRPGSVEVEAAETESADSEA